ncbi:MAG: hypothetical protein RBS40_02495 [Rhodocyclaceae bacterium]|nr:hypothetical protein [Rhodocyclaceae bacterium]
MNGLLLVARLVGGVGVVACVAAVLLRLTGHYYVMGGLSSGTLLQGGMAALLIACFGLLLVLVGRKG